VAKNPSIGRAGARPGALALAAAIGLASAAWAAFQWWQLIVARRGGQVICAPGGGGHCAEVWDSPFASAIHHWTGLPVAGWGVAWGVIAFALPFVTRARMARRRASDTWLAATFVTGIAGAFGVAALLGASLRFGHICTTCALTYVLAMAYAAVCFVAVRGAVPSALVRGGALAAGGLALAFSFLLVPGLRTPPNATAAGARAVGEVPRLPADASDDEELARFIQDLPEQGRQLLSDTLADYAASPVWEPPPTRTVIGPNNARLRLTEWSDTLCSHCAQLHDTLLQLQERFGPEAFSLAPHQYPLDPSCNASVKREDSNPLPCLGARIKICAEGKSGEFELSSELFRRQQELTESLALDLAKGVVPPDELEACLHSPETERKLQDDIRWAVDHGIQGTPLLLISGRKALPFPPLIYALALTRGAPSNPAFAALPPPQPIPVPH
jgi:protein-disulfide isomerase